MFKNTSHAPSFKVIVSYYKPSRSILNFFELILKCCPCKWPRPVPAQLSFPCKFEKFWSEVINLKHYNFFRMPLNEMSRMVAIFFSNLDEEKRLFENTYSATVIVHINIKLICQKRIIHIPGLIVWFDFLNSIEVMYVIIESCSAKFDSLPFTQMRYELLTSAILMMLYNYIHVCTTYVCYSL